MHMYTYTHTLPHAADLLSQSYLRVQTFKGSSWIHSKSCTTHVHIYVYTYVYWGVRYYPSWFLFVLQTPSEVSVFALKKKLSNVYCVRLGHISKAWKLVEVLLIPKDGKRSYFGAKDLRPISLFSFPLKTMERFMELYIRSRIPRAKLLRAQQTYIRVMAGGSPYAQGFCCIYLSRHLGSFQQWVARGGV